MKGSFFRCIAAALVVGTGACGVSSTGLSPTDASAGGTSGSVVCPAGLTEQAAWPAKTSYTSCVRPCGPGGILFETCSQIDRATCQAKRGCVCLEAPCVTCGDCPFQALPDCYLPTNGATATRCLDRVSEGGACAPACSQQLCLLADGKTGCVCGSKGTYACAAWNGTNWQ